MKDSIFHFWITDGTGQPFCARRAFRLSKVPEKAIACVCGLGQFQFYVNGHKVSDHVLDPAWSAYDRLVYYIPFDIAEYLQEGWNVMAAEVGNGWYDADASFGYFFHFPSFMPENPNGYRPFNSELVLAVHAEIGETVIDTDESWLVRPHFITHSNCYGSEMQDGRNYKEGWNLPDDCAASDEKVTGGRQGNAVSEVSEGWRHARIAEAGGKLNRITVRQTMPPVRVIRTLEGRYLGTVNGHTIYDFGQNCSGMLRFEVRGKRGEAVHAWPAEKLDDRGDVDQMAKNWLKIDVEEAYIPAEDQQWETFDMTFTYVGCRYVAFDVDPQQLRNVSLRVISSAGERAGEFSCDDDRFMKIYDIIERSVESNMVSVHTDCPTIERFAWQEENHLMAPSIMYMKKVRQHWEKFLRDTRLAQHTKDDWFHDSHHGRYYPGEGLIPSQAPCYIPNVLPVEGLGDFYNVIGWGSTIILGPYWHYWFYGDRKIIQENYEAGCRYFHFIQTCVDENGFISNGLGDWGNPSGEYARENVETAFLYLDAEILRRFAVILGKTDDAECFARDASQIRDNYNRKLLVYDEVQQRYCYRLWNRDVVVMTQAAEAMPLCFGMVPDQRRDDVEESFRKTLLDAGCIRSGEVGQPYIIEMMTRLGMDGILAEFILRPEHPGYYAFVADGETSLGEYWENNPRSHNHDMMGHIIAWYYNGIAGIRPLEPGFSKTLVRPWMPDQLNRMSCRYASASGVISVQMERLQNGSVQLEVSADPGIELVIDKSKLAAQGDCHDKL